MKLMKLVVIKFSDFMKLMQVTTLDITFVSFINLTQISAGGLCNETDITHLHPNSNNST
jgi:hypothetical protein